MFNSDRLRGPGHLKDSAQGAAAPWGLNDSSPNPESVGASCALKTEGGSVLEDS